MAKISLPDFFRYFAGTAEQLEAVVLLESMMDSKLLQDDSAWVIKYREQPTPPPAPPVDSTVGICTPELMQRLTGFSADKFDSVFCNDCNRLFHETGFDQHPHCQMMLMANMMHETCNFVYMQEIASGEAYNNRSDLGNGPTDGPKYKGAGVLQLTGRYNYQRLSDDLGDPKVMDGVDYVSNTYPFTSAKTWIRENDLLNVCLNQGFDACCQRINGGWNGIDDRRAKYGICQREMA